MYIFFTTLYINSTTCEEYVPFRFVPSIQRRVLLTFYTEELGYVYDLKGMEVLQR